MSRHAGARCLALALALAAGGCKAAPDQVDPATAHQDPQAIKADVRPALGLFTTLPIYWGEAADFAETLSGAAPPGWVRGALEKRYRLDPLDTLEAEDLKGRAMLMIAQPRALSGTENVALDAWVRGGGRLLLFADPMLTAHSRFAIGDRRRPQDVVLLSPILTHWGLALTFDDEAPEAERKVRWSGLDLPVNLPGELSSRAGSPCRVEARLIATCSIGKGRVVVVADAALLDTEGDAATREPALEKLEQRAFD